MVAEIPNHYTHSPSSYYGTPHLTINKEATIDLDSSSAWPDNINSGEPNRPR